MRKIGFIIFIFVVVVISPLWAKSIQVAPRISDREIVERLTRLEEGQKALNKRLDEVEWSLNKRIDDVNKRIDDLRAEMNARFAAMDKRLDTLQWMLGLFISISLVILGFVLRMQWQMQKRQTSLETMLKEQKEEIAFLKNLIDKLLSPRGVL
jgi:peptidoglycan hydrolase CwlO-like protein